jgi:hypothetical protein
VRLLDGASNGFVEHLHRIVVAELSCVRLGQAETGGHYLNGQLKADHAIALCQNGCQFLEMCGKPDKRLSIVRSTISIATDNTPGYRQGLLRSQSQ